MSATSNAYRIAGPTYALSVTASASSVAVLPSENTNANYAIFQNTGTNAVCVAINQLPANQTAVTIPLAFPVPGTPTAPQTQPTFVLPAAPAGIVVAVPSGGMSVTMIGASAGPAVVYMGYVEQS